MKSRTIVARNTGRTTRALPIMAPFNLVINLEWLEKEKDNYPAITEDYGKHEDPDGFGETVTNAILMARERAGTTRTTRTMKTNKPEVDRISLHDFFRDDINQNNRR